MKHYSFPAKEAEAASAEAEKVEDPLVELYNEDGEVMMSMLSSELVSLLFITCSLIF